MPRPLRIEYEGAWYHVMNRGINHQCIYRNIYHKNIFLSLLGELTQKFFIETHAYCLMDNHYHLLLRTPIPNLGKAMQHLDGIFTRRYNLSENRDGPLFRGRYKAILIEEESHLLQVSRYIHLNPVSAAICKNPEDYSWSSYRYYLNTTSAPSWLKTGLILNYFGNNNPKNEYNNFVAQGIDEDTQKFYSKAFIPVVFGKEKFRAEHLNKITPKQLIFCNPDIRRIKNLPDILDIVKIVSEYFGIDIDNLKSTRPGVKNTPRMTAIYFSKRFAQSSYKQISNYFLNITSASVSMVIKRFEFLLLHDSEIHLVYESIKKKLIDRMFHVDT